MSELSTFFSTPKVQVNIVPFGSIQLINSHCNECQSPSDIDKDDTSFEFPTGSVISGSIRYDQLTFSPISL